LIANGLGEAHIHKLSVTSPILYYKTIALRVNDKLPQICM